jgi:hypothetical protein
MDAKPPSIPGQDSKTRRQRTPPEAAQAENLLAEIVLADGSAVRPRLWRPAGKLARASPADALDFVPRALRAANGRRRLP